MTAESNAVQSAVVAPQPNLDVVVLGGGGHVGLPLSLALAKAGLRVGILDIAEATLAQIGSGEMPFIETGADELLGELLPTGRIELSATAAMLSRTRNVIVVVGTPIDEFLNPSMTVFERTVEQMFQHMQPGTLVVLRSTVYPGTSEYITAAFAARSCDVLVAFCPERIAEGHALEELSSLPQIVGSDDDEAGDRAEKLFRNLTSEIVRVPTKEA